MTPIWLPQGECWTTERLDGAALWLPPGAWEVPMRVQLRLLPKVLTNARLETPRLMRYLALVESKHPTSPYLAILGAGPGAPGPGLRLPSDAAGAGALRRRRHPRRHTWRRDTERNVQLYRRHGFKVTEEFPLPGEGPPIWLMWRDPK